MKSGRGGVVLSLGLVVLFSLASCGSGGSKILQGHAASPIEVVGQAAVVTNSYGLPNGTGYNASVAFTVKNPNSGVAAKDVPYRVTLKGSGQVLYTSDGTDTLTIGPQQTKLVVLDFDSGLPVNIKPDAAEVRLYPAPSMYVSASAVPDMSLWKLQNVNFQCPQVQVGCEMTGDLTWSGNTPQTNITVSVAAHAGSDASGLVISSGSGSPDTDQVAPGQTVPIKVEMTGFDQPEAEGQTLLPTGQFTPEFGFESSPA